MSNPLLENTTLPQFSKIKPEHIEVAIDTLLAEARTIVEQQLQSTTAYSWENLIAPIENVEDKLNKAWSPISHMNSVINTDELRDAYNVCLPKLSEYSTEMGQNRALFEAYKYIKNSHEFSTLHIAQKKTIDNALRDFTLSGIDLSLQEQQRYKQISQELSRLASKYEENLLDATNAWSKHITDIEMLSGLPESALEQAKQAAQSRIKMDG